MKGSRRDQQLPRTRDGRARETGSRVASLRRRRGLAAPSLYAAVGLAISSIRKIVSFMENMREDEQGRWYVPRNSEPGSDRLALGEGGGYADDDVWVLSDALPDDD